MVRMFNLFILPSAGATVLANQGRDSGEELGRPTEFALDLVRGDHVGLALELLYDRGVVVVPQPQVRLQIWRALYGIAGPLQSILDKPQRIHLLAGQYMRQTSTSVSQADEYHLGESFIENRGRRHGLSARETFAMSYTASWR